MTDHEAKVRIHDALTSTSASLRRTLDTSSSLELCRAATDILYGLHKLQLRVEMEEPESLLREIRTMADELTSFAAKKEALGYESGTYKCKSDCELCLAEAESALEKVLCYALFARCIAKG